IISLQTLGVAVLTGLWIYEFITQGSEDLVSAVSLLLVMVAAVGWLAATASGVYQKKRWAFSSSVVAELLTVILGLALIPGDLVLGWVLLGPAIVALIILLSRNLGQQISKES
ncbi:MAG TPA: hypothetical protein VIB61_01325, partial [Microbacteriaceae bacterium]